ncbi:hypothetical protein ILYODFUR_038004 [Ilyodon furcidens]|uniref:Uncharacterized protein n=1 Tax=Ilyodon furcidens TaxID=33524 RepID=A0ABV0UBS1_9TELE
MPFWTAYTLPHEEDLTPIPEGSPSASCIRVDPRVSPVHSQSCTAYNQNKYLTYGFLFPPELATSPESRYDSSLITNTVPMYPSFKSKQWLALKCNSEK